MTSTQWTSVSVTLFAVISCDIGLNDNTLANVETLETSGGHHSPMSIFHIHNNNIFTIKTNFNE